MKRGRTLQEVGAELIRQRKNRKDFLADTRNLEMETTDGVSKLAVLLGNTEKRYTVGPIAHQQIASRLQIPYRYYQKMQQKFPMLLDESVNGWFRQIPERRMVRVLDGNVRAFLSDRYRRLDHLELCSAVLPVIQDMKGAEMVSCDVTDAHLYLKVINRKLKEEVAVGDIVQAGFVISNSEIGMGSLRVEPLLFRLVCKNGLIIKDYAQKKYHVGRQINEQTNDAYELYSDETLAQDDKSFFMKVQDIVRSAVDETKFQLSVRKLQETRRIPLTYNPVEAVELLADTFQLTQNERGDILRQLFLGKDNSRYGLINAITAASQLSVSYERATELERIGGELLAYPVPQMALSTPITMPSMRNITPKRPSVTLVR